jgi:hypothetical protein
MALTIGDEWIRSDRCLQVAMAVLGGWVLSWRRGLWTRDEAIIAMIRAERGDLLPHPAAATRAS